MPSAMRVLMMRWMPSAATMRSIAELAGDAVDGDLRRGAIEPRLAAEEALGIEKAEDEIGVGDRRLGAAAPVAGGAGSRARALGPDVQHAAGIDARDRAAAGADAGDVDALQGDALAGEAAVGGDRRLAADDERDVGRGAAHVERDEVAVADDARRILAAGDAARGAREHAAGREPHRFRNGRDAAVRLDDEHRPGKPGVAAAGSRGA